MRTMKNEHILWAYADRNDGVPGKVLIIGLTDTGIAFLKAQDGNAFPIDPPMGRFLDVSKVIVFREKNKAALKARLAEAGTLVSEVN